MTISKSLIAISGALALLVPLSLQATPKTHSPMTVGQEARGTLQDVRASADATARQAEQLELYIADVNTDADGQLVPLLNMKDDVNLIGKEISSLEAERASLSPWEQKALDKVIPLVEAAAANTQNAIVYFNHNKPHLWTAEYKGYTDKVLADSHEIANTLRDFLKYDKAREEEQQLQSSVGAGAN